MATLGTHWKCDGSYVEIPAAVSVVEIAMVQPPDTDGQVDPFSPDAVRRVEIPLHATDQGWHLMGQDVLRQL